MWKVCASLSLIVTFLHLLQKHAHIMNEQNNKILYQKMVGWHKKTPTIYENAFCLKINVHEDKEN